MDFDNNSVSNIIHQCYIYYEIFFPKKNIDLWNQHLSSSPWHLLQKRKVNKYFNQMLEEKRKKEINKTVLEIVDLYIISYHKNAMQSFCRHVSRYIRPLFCCYTSIHYHKCIVYMNCRNVYRCILFRIYICSFCATPSIYKNA